MSEHEHEYQLDVQGGYCYCESCDDEWSIQELLKERIENQARIKALEGVVEAVRQFLELDMELDDKLSHPTGEEISSNLLAVSKAKLGLLDAFTKLEEDE
jgi:hypothetical protein